MDLSLKSIWIPLYKHPKREYIRTRFEVVRMEETRDAINARYDVGMESSFHTLCMISA